MIPLLILITIALLITWQIVDAVRISRRPARPEDGCCGCGARECDVLVGAGRGEGYCWACIDTWPAGGTPLDDLGVSVLPGRERSGATA